MPNPLNNIGDKELMGHRCRFVYVLAGFSQLQLGPFRPGAGRDCLGL